MKTSHKLIFSLLFFIPLINFAQYTETINSNIPGRSMSAYAVGKTLIQFETSGYYIVENDKRSLRQDDGAGGGAFFALRYGVWKEEFEAVATGEYRNIKYQKYPSNSKNGLRSLDIGAKYLIYDAFKNYEEKPNVYSWKANKKFKWRRLRPSIGFYLGANLNLTDNRFSPVYSTFGPKIMLLIHNDLNNGFILTSNIVANNFIDNTANYAAIITLSKGFSDKFSLYVEHENYIGNFKHMAFTFGTTYILKEDIQIHGTFSGAFLHGDLPGQRYGGLGFSWRFDRNHKPVELNGKGEKNHNKKGKDGEENSKSGSRKVRNPPIKFN